ncbi:hypothetical protein ED733_007522 [Metarhizium rileyi]|uniref:Peptidase M60 domain-containing protein n=1 Tax=Metarhizium rileyi (strain RCEF 4871) TaxID=1649241 RepID=A0A5C6GMH3_METRR|nr:hypothetical protein ED733_007522 [Metarhizium rileyi]
MKLDLAVGSPSILVQADPSKFAQSRTITVSAQADAQAERKRLRQLFLGTDFQPTGFDLNARLPLDVTISGADKPETLVGTPGLINPNSPNTNQNAYLKIFGPLENGNRTIPPTSGGILYIRYVYGSGQEIPCPVVVTLAEGDAAQPFPLFNQGETTSAEWKDLLAQTTIAFAEHDGKGVILTGLAVNAKEYADRNQGDIIAVQDRISGLSSTAPDPKDRPSSLRPMVAQGTLTQYAYAGDYRAAIGKNMVADIWWQPELLKSWKIWHELGHQRQHQSIWGWSALVMFEQLRVAYHGGDEFYHKLHTISRATPASDMTGEADKSTSA